MGLEIQGSVNSILGSVQQTMGAVKKHVEKTAKVAANAIAGNYAGAAEEASKDIKVDQNNAAAATQSGVEQTQPVASPQAQAASLAEQSAANEIKAKAEQKAKIDKLQTNFGGRVEDLPEAMRKRIYEEYNK